MSDKLLTEGKLNSMKLWELGELALADLDKCIGQGVVIDMSIWIQPLITGRCCVCLAGAVLYKELNRRSEPLRFPKFALAINSLRTGDVENALRFMYGLTAQRTLNRHIVSYMTQPAVWREQFQQLLKDLKEADL